MPRSDTYYIVKLIPHVNITMAVSPSICSIASSMEPFFQPTFSFLDWFRPLRMAIGVEVGGGMVVPQTELALRGPGGERGIREGAGTWSPECRTHFPAKNVYLAFTRSKSSGKQRVPESAWPFS